VNNCFPFSPLEVQYANPASLFHLGASQCEERGQSSEEGNERKDLEYEQGGRELITGTKRKKRVDAERARCNRECEKTTRKGEYGDNKD
jgi:hypothetical protein